MQLFFFVFYAMVSLAPGRNHAAVATAITDVALESRPLFANDESRLKTAAFMVSVAFRESSFQADAIGDHGKAKCLFQLWNAPNDVLTDSRLCASIAIERMRESIKSCGRDNMLGIYAAGPEGCASAKAKRISRDRLQLAERLGKRMPGLGE